MSGGVDSSASALLLKEQGYEVIGLFMRSGVVEETACRVEQTAGGGMELPVVSTKAHKQGCCSASDAADARRVADALDIPFHALNFREEFGRIQDYFADEYLAGRTPNPCVQCNVWLKFGKLWEFARQVGAEHIATGHYARVGMPGCGSKTSHQPDGQARGTTIVGDCSPSLAVRAGMETASGDAVFAKDRVSGAPGLFRGRDPDKDQSYVLFGIRRELLGRILFPVGGHTKSEIRELARRAGIGTAEKPDSQEICFIPDNDYAAFVERHRGEQETAGELVDTAGNVVGHHPGYERFTIGQRKGLGVTFGAPRFVVRIEPESRRVVIGTREELGRTDLEADRLNWLMEDVPTEFRCMAQIRYQHRAAECTVAVGDGDRMQVTFDEPQFGVAPGQAVVLYGGERVLGGGWIR
jgi:tRNA-specific 2-thiouridylase